jgi:hypothetical protein
VKQIRECVALLGVVGPAIWLWLRWDAISATVPVHFGVDGAANRFAGRRALWVLVAVSALLYLLLRIAPRFKRAFNLPAPLDDPLRSRMEAASVEMLAWMRLEIAWLFASLIVSSVRIAQKMAGGLGGWAVLLPALVILPTIGIFLFRMLRMGRPTVR